MSNPISALELSKPPTDARAHEFYEPSTAGDFASIGTELIMRDMLILEPLFKAAFQWLKAWLLSLNANHRSDLGKLD